MILSCDFRKIESFDFDSKIFKSESNDFVVWILEKSKHLILILYSKVSKNDLIFEALITTTESIKKPNFFAFIYNFRTVFD